MTSFITSKYQLFNLVFCLMTIHLQQFSAHVVPIPTFHTTVAIPASNSLTFCPNLSIQCPFDVLISNLILPCHSMGNLANPIYATSSCLSCPFVIAADSVTPVGLHHRLHIRPKDHTLLPYHIPVTSLNF